MSLDWYRARRASKPITGFGWRGELALGVFLGILIPELLGFSWQFFVLESIWRVWDWPALYYLVPRMMPLSVSLFMPEFSPLSVLPVFIGMGIAPVRFGRWRWGGLFAASLVVPYGMYVGYTYSLPYFRVGPEWFWTVCSLTIGAGLVWLATRSKFLALVWLGMIPCALILPAYWRSPLADWLDIPVNLLLGGNTTWPLPGYAMFLLTGLAAIWWGVRVRRELQLPGRCLGCGYELSGLNADNCPECGKGLRGGAAEISRG